MNNAKLTQDELQAIKERAEKAQGYRWLVEGGKFGEHRIVSQAHYADELLISNEVTCEVYSQADAEFIANARQDIPKLVAEVERLQKAIDNAISLLPDGENRLANRYLCEALGVDEDHYGFFSGGDDD